MQQKKVFSAVYLKHENIQDVQNLHILHSLISVSWHCHVIWTASCNFPFHRFPRDPSGFSYSKETKVCSLASFHLIVHARDCGGVVHIHVMLWSDKCIPSPQFWLAFARNMLLHTTANAVLSYCVNFSSFASLSHSLALFIWHFSSLLKATNPQRI